LCIALWPTKVLMLRNTNSWPWYFFVFWLERGKKLIQPNVKITHEHVTQPGSHPMQLPSTMQSSFSNAKRARLNRKPHHERGFSSASIRKPTVWSYVQRVAPKGSASAQPTPPFCPAFHPAPTGFWSWPYIIQSPVIEEGKNAANLIRDAFFSKNHSNQKISAKSTTVGNMLYSNRNTSIDKWIRL